MLSTYRKKWQGVQYTVK